MSLFCLALKSHIVENKDKETERSKREILTKFDANHSPLEEMVLRCEQI